MVEPLNRVREEPRRLHEMLSPTACRSCRLLKIRCSRGSPSCFRCQKKRVACVYPEPPNRRLLAARRNERTASLQYHGRPDANSEGEELLRLSGPVRVPHASDPVNDEMAFVEFMMDPQSQSGAAPLPLSSEFFPISPSHGSPAPEAIPPPNDGYRTACFVGSPRDYTVSEDPRRLPEREIGLLLIEVYFSRVFSASLLYDHKAFVEGYCAGTLPKHTLLSTFAISSLFCCSSPAETCGKKSSLGELKSLGDRGREWAQWASELVLAKSDTPNLACICSCDVLGLYWFAVGENERSLFHATVSQTSLYILDRKTNHGSTDPQFWIPRAISRERVYWACFVKSCISELAPGCRPFDLDIDSIIERGSPQPGRADPLSFASPPTVRNGYIDWLVWDETFSQTSVIYMLEAFGLWRKVKDFVRELEKSTYQSCLSTFFELDGNLQQFHSSLPSEFKNDNLMDHPHREPLQRNAFFILSVYHLCMIFLHSSMVPALSLSTAGHTIPPAIIKISSKTATTHAQLFAKMTCSYLNTTPDMAKVPSFVGYCAFVAGMVLSAVMSFTGLEKGQGVRRDGAICALLLWEIKVYWPTLQIFYQDLETHFHLSEFDYPSLLRNGSTNLQPNSSLRISDLNDSGVAAFIAASCDLAYSPKSEFIHRPYSDGHVEHSSISSTSPEGNRSNSDNTGYGETTSADAEVRSIDVINMGSPPGELPPDLDHSTPSWSNFFIPAECGLFGKN